MIAMRLTRREFLWGAGASGMAFPLLVRAQTVDTGRFPHGVASGDPLTDRVILWTRVAAPAGSRTAEVRWRVATDSTLRNQVQTGMVSTSADRDHTIKVDVGGLQPGQVYYYTFEFAGERSPTGRTRTLPQRADRLRLATVSCANYPAGFFNVYGLLARRDDLDVVVHLGDYIYEFANAVYGDGRRLNRLPIPLTEAVTLSEYRQRYATYRADPDLQAAHRQHPFIAVWDDHESANNAWRGGATNHNPELGEGEWSARRAAAWRAYLEWMPVREQADTDIRLYRAFRFGNLADLVMLDTRSFRDRQVAQDDLAALADPGRRMLGGVQEAWLYETLRASQQDGIGWRLIGQQVLFSRVAPPGRAVQSNDVWDAYQAERGRIEQFLERERLTNVAILTGDLHSSWAFDVPRDPWNGYRPQTGAGSLAVEIVTPAISSPGLMTPDQAATIVPALRVAVPSLKFLDGHRQGYVLVTITKQQLRAEWHHVATVAEQSSEARVAATLVCESGAAHLATG